MAPLLVRQGRGRICSLLAVTALAAFLAAAAAQVAAAGGGSPCPSCPNRIPPPSGPPSNGTGSGPTPVGSRGAGQGAPSAPGAAGAAQPMQPLVSLGSISVLNGVASLTGTVNASAGLDASANVGVDLTVNASPVTVSAGGQFSASVDLNADAGIDLQASASSGVQYDLSIPTSAVLQAGASASASASASTSATASATAQLDADAVTLLVPADGFTIVDGVGIEAQVQAAATAGIAVLNLNGANLLAQLDAQASASAGASGQSSGSSSSSGSLSGSSGAGSSGSPSASPASASAPVSGQAKQVALTVTGTNGVSETSTVPVNRVSSVIRVGKSSSVSAFGARGIRIASVAFDTSRLARTHHLGVTVLVRDRRNYLVRDAIVMVSPTPHRASVAGSWAATSDVLGRARFSVPISSRSAGRIYVTVTAKTPRAKTRVTRSVGIGGGRAA